MKTNMDRTEGNRISGTLRRSPAPNGAGATTVKLRGKKKKEDDDYFFVPKGHWWTEYDAEWEKIDKKRRRSKVR